MRIPFSKLSHQLRMAIYIQLHLIVFSDNDLLFSENIKRRKLSMTKHIAVVFILGIEPRKANERVILLVNFFLKLIQNL